MEQISIQDSNGTHRLWIVLSSNEIYWKVMYRIYCKNWKSLIVSIAKAFRYHSIPNTIQCLSVFFGLSMPKPNGHAAILDFILIKFMTPHS